jgi:serine/threonine protein kinase
MGTKIATMRTLQGHANMLTLHEVFEDAEGFHVVVEFCKGKALLESIHDRVRSHSSSCKHFLQAVPTRSSCKPLQSLNPLA